ncbi:MAG: VWA domain-containing protein [Bifidobacteriaceae bacterium]|jgi:PKD repeat protein|nr:VWA domain-containing protein [Bifidobacteriaceae bacterium]
MRSLFPSTLALRFNRRVVSDAVRPGSRHRPRSRQPGSRWRRRVVRTAAVLGAAALAAAMIVLPAQVSSADVNLEAAFTSQPSTGPTNVAFERLGASVVGVSSTRSDAAADAARNVLSARNGSWVSAGSEDAEWIVLDLSTAWELTEVRVTSPSYYNLVAINASFGDAATGPFTQFAAVASPGAQTSTLPVPPGARGRYLRLDFPASTPARWVEIGRVEALSGQVGGARVDFSDAAVAGSDAITDWEWDFGDGSAHSHTQDTSHIFANPGLYSVVLTVTDAAGDTATVTRLQRVTPPLHPELNPASPVESNSSPVQLLVDPVELNAAELVELFVDWDDGSATQRVTSFGSPPNLTGIAHYYRDDGVYQITLNGTDVRGEAMRTVVFEATIANAPPTVNLSARYVLPADGSWSLPSYSASDVNADLPSLACALDYGDGTSQSGLCTELANWSAHVYQGGIFLAVLTATDKDGGATSRSAVVNHQAPLSHFVNLYPVAGTATANEVTMRVKVWDWSDWTEAVGVDVEIAVGSWSQTVTTGAQGLAELRVPRVAGVPVTATVTNVPGATTWSGGDSNDLSALNKPQGDVLFLVDDSESMAGAQASVRTNIGFIAEQLGTTLDYQIGIMPLNVAGGSARPRIYAPATDSLDWIHDAVGRLTISPGGELGVDTIVDAFETRVGLRAEAPSCLVLVADEATQQSLHTVQQAADALAANRGTLYSIVPTTPVAGGSNQEYRDLATNSGGAVFEFSSFVSDPQPLLQALTTQCVASVLELTDLSVTVGDGRTEVGQTGSGVHTVTVTNHGTTDAAGVALELEVTGPVTLGQVSGQGVAAAMPGGGSKITWPAFNLAGGATTSFTVAWSVSAGAQLGDLVEASAQVSDDGANGADITPANNEARDVTTVTAAPPPNDQTVTVVYVDDHAGGVAVTPTSGARVSVTGPALAAVGFTQGEAEAGVPAGYVFVSLDNVATFDDDDAAAQVITVHVGHHHSYSDLQTTRTIEYLGAGAATPAAVSQSVRWRVDSDDVTGLTTYSLAEGYPPVVSPTVPGYTADPLTVPATPAVASTAIPPADSSAQVVYVAGTDQVVAVVYVDDDSGGAEVSPAAGARTRLVGARLSPVGFTAAEAEAGVPPNYVFVSLDNVTTFDDDDAQTQVITVHLAHHHTVSTLVVTRTIEYTGAGNATPTPVTDDVLWHVDTDDVTGETAYWSSEGYPAVQSPDVDGHAVDRELVAGTNPVARTSVPPADQVEHVAYRPLAAPGPTPTPTPTPTPAPTPAPASPSSPAPAPTSTDPGELPFTGSPGLAGMVVAAGLLISLGVALIRNRRGGRARS